MFRGHIYVIIRIRKDQKSITEVMLSPSHLWPTGMGFVLYHFKFQDQSLNSFSFFQWCSFLFQILHLDVKH